MSDTDTIYQRGDGVTAEPSGDRTIVLDADGENMITLSPVGSLIWTMLPADSDTIVDGLSNTFPDVERGLLAADADTFLRELLALDLLVVLHADR